MQSQCLKCVMDKSATEIRFDEKGICNFCHQAQKALLEIRSTPDLEISVPANSKYDCLIGLSGGVDSSYMLLEAVRRGLKPLCFTIDNGWNDARADENIMRLVETLKVPFYRYTIDLAEFRKVQSAFMKAGLINLEIPTDHILMAASYEMAARNGIKYILSGGNVATESIMPASWSYTARDLTHIKDVCRRITGQKHINLPTCGIFKWNYYRWIKGIKTIYLLDYVKYNRKEAEQELKQIFGFQSTGDKHEENVFTKWFQNFYLFEKFSIDKRKAHLSSMINSGQITRQEALAELERNPVYPELGIERKVMSYPKARHEDYKNDKWFDRISKIIRWIKNI